MMDQTITTPFGGGRFSARAVLIQKAVAERQDRLKNGEGGNDTGRAEKWTVLSALTEARFAYGIGDRTIMVLEALLSFLPGRELDGASPAIVFPSNRALGARTRGMAPATIRRHLATLSELGFLIRRDSPNGKRYRVKGGEGQADEVFGFDLAPLALRAAEIQEEAEKVRALHREEKALRSRITLEQRAIATLIATALEEGRDGPFEDFASRFAGFASRLRRSGALEDLRQRLDGLAALRLEVEKAYLSSLSEEDMSTYDAHDERHILNSNTESHLELNDKESTESEAGFATDSDGSAEAEAKKTSDTTGSKTDERAAPERKGLPVTLERLLRACPTLLDYAPGGVLTHPADFLKTAGLVRSMLGISPDAWKVAEAALGREQAAAVIALMLERADKIRSPGGYLRSLTRKAEKGEFSLIPMLKALEG